MGSDRPPRGSGRRRAGSDRPPCAATLTCPLRRAFPGFPRRSGQAPMVAGSECGEAASESTMHIYGSGRPEHLSNVSAERASARVQC